MPKMTNGPKPREGYRARVKTQERGADITPSNARARQTTSGRASVDPDTRAPQGVPSGIKPENTRGRKTGRHTDNNIPSKMTRENPRAWRESGESKSTQNPLK